MKRLFVGMVALMLSANVFAQDLGNVMIGGSVGFTRADVNTKYLGATDDASSWQVSVEPFLLFPLSERFYMGVFGGYSQSKQADTDIRLWGAGVMPSYFLPITDKFFYNPTLSVGAADYKEKNTGFTQVELNGWSFYSRLQFLSFKYKVSHFLIGANFGGITYNYLNATGGGLEVKTNNWNVDFSIAPTLSLTFVFG